MRKLIVLLALMLGACAAHGQTFVVYSCNASGCTQNGHPVNPATGLNVQLANNISYTLTWTTTGSPTCAVTVDSSTNGSSWSTGGIISSQNCGSSGSASSSTLANWIRVTPTISGSGAVSFKLQGTTANGGGGATWGSITGTLSSQTDLQTALNAKAAGAASSTTGDVAVFSGTTGKILADSGLPLGLGGGAWLDNVAIGYQALNSNTSGQYNLAIGQTSLFFNTIGSYNTSVGSGDNLSANTSGSSNTAIGNAAGYTATPANANVSGSNNTWIGYESGPGIATQLNNATAIGNGALNTASNQVVIGNSSVTSTVLNGAVSGATSYNGLTLTPLTTGFSVAGGTTSKTLTVSNTLTLAATSDSETLNIGPGGTLGTAAFTSAPTASSITTLLQGLTGCDTSGYVYTPAGSDCVAQTGGGAVSSVSNSDSTLTISPTTGAVVASLNLGHANTWTAAQTFPGATFSGTGAGYFALTQGADNCVANQPTGSVCWEAPASGVTSYHGLFAVSPSSGIPHYAYSAPTITETISAITPSDATGNTTGSGNFVLATSPTFVTGLSSPAITDSGILQYGVLFAGSGGLLSGIPADFYYNDTGYDSLPTLQLGVRGSQPIDAHFEVYGSNDTSAHFHNVGTTGTGLSADGGIISLSAVPTGAALGSGVIMGTLQFGGSDSTSDTEATGAIISAWTTQAWSGSAFGSQLKFYTTPNSSTTLTQAMQIGQDQGVTVGSSSVTDEGSGTLNAGTGLYVGGTAVALTGVDINTSNQVTNLSYVTNASLANSGLVSASTTVNGQTCTLGGSCTVTASGAVHNPSANGIVECTGTNCSTSTTIATGNSSGNIPLVGSIASQFSFYYPASAAGTVGSSTVLYQMEFGKPFSIPAITAGTGVNSAGRTSVLLAPAPAAAWVITVNKIADAGTSAAPCSGSSTAIGTLSVSTSNLPTFAGSWTSGTISFAVGDCIQYVAPSTVDTNSPIPSQFTQAGLS